MVTVFLVNVIIEVILLKMKTATIEIRISISATKVMIVIMEMTVTVTVLIIDFLAVLREPKSRNTSKPDAKPHCWNAYF